MKRTRAYRCDEKGRFGFVHNYSRNCSCQDCLTLFLGLMDGLFCVVSADGKYKMKLPSKKATIWEQDCELKAGQLRAT